MFSIFTGIGTDVSAQLVNNNTVIFPATPDPGQSDPTSTEYVPNQIIVKLVDTGNGALPKSSPTGMVDNSEFPESIRRLNEQFGVMNAAEQFRRFSPYKEKSAALQNNTRAPTTDLESRLLQRLERAPLVKRSPSLVGVYVLDLTQQSIPLEIVVQMYQADSNIEYAELNPMLHTTITPNDADFAVQWPLHNTGQLYPESGSYNTPPGTPDADMDVAEAWNIQTGSSNIVVAVIDTGVDLSHRDIAANIWNNAVEAAGVPGLDDDGNGIIDDINGYDFANVDNNPTDDHGHGTHVAGTIAAAGNNGLDTAGVSWNATILPLKALRSTGSGSTTAVAEAIFYAVEQGADIISMSLGSTTDTETLRTAVAFAHSQGVLCIASAGNYNSPNASFPAAYPTVLNVGATDSTDSKASFSNHSTWVDIAAPGVDILSLRASGTSMGATQNEFTTVASGTSMACPHVSGVAALILAKNPSFSPDEVRSVLKMTSDGYYSTRYLGQGRVNAATALAVNAAPPIARLDLGEFSADQTYVSESIPIRGTAAGNNFSHYEIFLGEGENPPTMSLFHASNIPVVNDALMDVLDIVLLTENIWTVKLVVHDVRGWTVENLSFIRPLHFLQTFPLDNDILNPGGVLEIRGTPHEDLTVTAIEYGLGYEPGTWYDSGIELDTDPNDDIVGTWDTSPIIENDFYTIRLTLSTMAGDDSYAYVRSMYFNTQLKEGWPQYVHRRSPWTTMFDVGYSIADLDGDGLSEILAMESGQVYTDSNPVLWVYNHDGTVKWSRVLDRYPMVEGSFLGPYNSIPVIGDIDGDGDLEIFVDIGQPYPQRDVDFSMYGFDSNGDDLPGWPIDLPMGRGETLLADMTNDGDLELVYRSRVYKPDPEYGYAHKIFVINRHGETLSSISVPKSRWGYTLRDALLAVGNFDSDPELEIVTRFAVYAETGGTTVEYPVIYNLDGSFVPGWPAVSRTDGVFAFATGNLDGIEGDELVTIQAQNLETGEDGGFYVYDASGNLLPGWPIFDDVRVSHNSFTGVALSDMDSNGSIEICFSSYDTLGIYDIHGQPLPGWPITPSIGWSLFHHNPVLADITGDGELDVVIRAGSLRENDLKTGNFVRSGGIWAWHMDGSPIDLNPNSVKAAMWLDQYTDGRPTVTDLDNDGKLDLICTTRDNTKFWGLKDRKTRDTHYVFELDVPYDPALTSWPTWQGNIFGTGRYHLPDSIEITHLRVIGPATVLEGESATYQCVARYNNQTTQRLSSGVTWSESSIHATLDNDGLFDASLVDENTPTTITASFGGFTTQFDVTILDDSPSIINVTPPTLSQSVLEGDSGTNDTIQVTNIGGRNLAYTIDDDASWLSISPQSGTSSGESDTITIQYAISDLEPGEYDAAITIADDSATNSPQTVTVSLTVEAANPVIGVNPPSLSRTAFFGTNEIIDTFQISNTGTGALDYSVFGNRMWLSVSPALGTSTGESDTIDVTIDSSGLSVGDHDATIYVFDRTDSNNSETIPVSVTVSPPPPVISVTPSTLSPTTHHGEDAPNGSFQISNIGGGTLEYSISNNASWLSVSPALGTSTGESDSIAVIYETSVLPIGDYEATITISDSSQHRTPETILVSLAVGPPLPVVSVPFYLDNASNFNSGGVPSDGTATFIGVKNMVDETVTLTLTYTDTGGNDHSPVNKTYQMAPNSMVSWRPFADDPAEGPNGGQLVPNTSANAAWGSVRIVADGPIAGRLISLDGVQQSTAMMLLPSGGGSTKVSVPFYLDNASNFNGGNVPSDGTATFVVVKNMNNQPTILTLTYTDTEGNDHTPSKNTYVLAPHSMVSWRPNADDPVEGPSAGQLVPNTSDGPAWGSVLIDADGPITGRLIALDGTQDSTAMMLLPAGEGSTTMSVPFYLDDASNFDDEGVPADGTATFIGVKNMTNEPVTLTLVYTDTQGNDHTPTQNTYLLAANSMVSWRPTADDPAEGPTAGQLVPNSTDGPTWGSIRIDATGLITGRLIAMDGTQNSTAMMLLPEGGGSSGISVPFYLDNASNSEDGNIPADGTATFVGVKNMGNEPVTLTISYTDTDGNDHTPQDNTYILQGRSMVSWRPFADDPVEGENDGQLVPNSAGGQAWGSIQIESDGQITGRLIVIDGTQSSTAMMLLPNSDK